MTRAGETLAEVEFRRIEREAHADARAGDGERNKDRAMEVIKGVAARRGRFREQYGFAVVTAKALEQLRWTTGDVPLLEIGAGNGYLAWELQNRGWDVIPTDPHSPEACGYDIGKGTHTWVMPLYGEVAVKMFPERTAIWSWPEMESYCADVVRAYDGERLILIGESPGGGTGDADFDEEVDTRFHQVATISIPNFPNLHDRIEVLQRR